MDVDLGPMNSLSFARQKGRTRRWRGTQPLLKPFTFFLQKNLMKGVNERGRWKPESKCLKQFMCHYHISFKLTRLHVSSDEELNYKSWLLRIAIGTLIGWNSIIIEQSRKCKTSLEMSSCKISTFLRFLDYIIFFIIIVFFRRPKIFFFWPNWIEL